MTLNRRMAALFAVLAVAALIAVAAALSFRTPLAAFEEFAGPDEVSKIAPLVRADWRDHAEGSSSRLAIYLTEADSAWMGLAHGLKSIGVPFIITDDAARAVRHDVVLAYPMISGATVAPADLDRLRAHAEGGGTLIAAQVLGGGMEDLFGFEAASEARAHHEIAFQDDPRTAFLDHPMERTVRIGNPDRPESWIGTVAYEGARTVLARFQDGGAAMTARDLQGGGAAYALGFDPGFFILKAHNDRDESAGRSYANAYEPSVDVWLRLIKSLYERHAALPATVWPVPEGRGIAAVVSFDIDYVQSMRNMAAYRAALDAFGAPGTFFIQTKYFRDYFDQGFFNDTTLGLVRDLTASGMEIASHSVSHTDVFATVPLGTGDERYPGYQPRVLGEDDTRGATVLGELRVSRHLLEAVSGQTVRSFRPGYLAVPSSLPQAMEASGYRHSSSVTAGNVLTHLPYRMAYDRDYAGATAIFEFPVAVEDEIPPSMDRRIDEAEALARRLSRYGGAFVILIHPDVLEGKLAFLEAILPRIEPDAWFGTLGQYGEWWAARDRVALDLAEQDGRITLVLSAPEKLEGLRIDLPENWRPVTLPPGAAHEPGRLLLSEVSGETQAVFERP